MTVKLKPNNNPLTPVRPINNLAYIFYYFQGVKPKLLLELKTKGFKDPEQAFIGLRNLVARDLLSGKLKSSDINDTNLALRVTQLCLDQKFLEAEISKLKMDQLIPKDQVVDVIDSDTNRLVIAAKHRDQLTKMFQAPTLMQGAPVDDGNPDPDQAIALLRLLERRRLSEAFKFPLNRIPEGFNKTDMDKKWATYACRARMAGELELLGFSRDDIAKAMGITKRTLSNLLINFRKSFDLPADRFTYKPRSKKGSQREQEDEFLTKRKGFLEIERKEKLIGISLSSVLRDRLLSFLFRTNELYGDESILKKHTLTEKELLKILVDLIRMLGQGAHYASMGVLKEHVQGYSSNAIADKFKITVSTVNRNLIIARKVLREYLDKYFNNKPPDVQGLEIDRFKWINLNKDYQRSLKLYLAGNNMKYIAKEVYPGDHEGDRDISIVLYQIRRHFGWTLEEFIKATTAYRCKQFKAIKVDSSIFRNNVLKMVYPETMPQALAVADQASWEKKLYQQVMTLAQQDEINSGALDQFQLRAKGIPYYEIESLTAVEDSSQEVHSMITKIRTRLDHELIAPYLFDYADRVKPSGVQPQASEATCIFAKNLNYNEGGLYVYPYLKGISSADIARSYGKNLTDIEPFLEVGLMKVKTKQSGYDHVTSMFYGVTIDPVKFSKLTEPDIEALKIFSPPETLSRVAKKLDIPLRSLKIAFTQTKELASGKPKLLSLPQWLQLRTPIEIAVAIELYDHGSIQADAIAKRIRQSGINCSDIQVQVILDRLMGA